LLTEIKSEWHHTSTHPYAVTVYTGTAVFVRQSGQERHNNTAGLQAALFWAVTQRVVAWRGQLEVKQ
jgi:hypothetical protein